MVKMIIMFNRRENMPYEEFMRYRRDVHTPLLFAIDEASLIQKFTVSYPVPAPRFSDSSYDAVVEAWFDNIEDMNTLYFSENFRKQLIQTTVILSTCRR